jgi:hypothetical protein
VRIGITAFEDRELMKGKSMFAEPFFSPAPPRRLVLHTASVVILSAAATAHAADPQNTCDTPTISGTPATMAIAGSPYAFQPSARYPYGQPLSFSVNNKPAWASFSIATGSLYGAPTSAQVGTYPDIQISVGNGKRMATLPAFSLTVRDGATATSTGRATLSWKEPTESTDGSALTDLAGVFIHYGTAASNLDHVAQVSSSLGNSYTISNLAAGTWYFAATAYTTAGMQSALSSVVSKNIP